MIRKFLRWIIKNKRYEYIGKFSSYQKAKRYSNKVTIYFDKRFTSKLYTPTDVEVTDRFYITSVLVSLLKKKIINVLDIGGGVNPIFSYIKQSTNISTNCIVLETEKLVKLIKRKIPRKFKKSVKYISSLDHLKLKHLDILCFNASIQYLDNYEKIIKKLSNLKPLYIVITRTPFHLENKNYYSLQCAIKGSLHPIIFFSLKKFKKLLFDNNYKLIFDNKYKINKNEHKSVSANKFFHKDLIFKKT